MPNQAKTFDRPEESRSFEHGRVDLVEIAGNKVGRINLQPGWRWSTAVKPIVVTDSCQVAHVSYAIGGRLHVRMDDGTEVVINAGEAYELGPGHDAWVEGTTRSPAWSSRASPSTPPDPADGSRSGSRFPFTSWSNAHPRRW